MTDKIGKSLHVRVDSLRPLSVDVAEKLMPEGDDWNAVGKFVVLTRQTVCLVALLPKLPPQAPSESTTGCLSSARPV